MANDKHTPLASADKTAHALRLIAEMLDDAKTIVVGLEHLQALPDKTKLGGQLTFIDGMSVCVSDAKAYLEFVMEKVSH